ncbi:hypothetical protein FB565_005805 [Actinoplanes lutulentus]|uniref:hypothetical protein n=1 Tax=Actinoplanes lutulentus TaxID=1287878 RepID=UPI0011B94BA4|nr:hypothetical protein [Actinoplanes lutulentus]MBB2946047.1 hypothetical protein [Actinoplanes lutulentus]
MTNWMTAAGLALIAGGLATLISFWSVIFGGGARRANRNGPDPRGRRAKAQNRPAIALPEAPPIEPEPVLLALPAAPMLLEQAPPPTKPGPIFVEQPQVFVEQPPVFVEQPQVFVEQPPVFVEQPQVFMEQPQIFDPLGYAESLVPGPRAEVDRTDLGYGDRVEGWVRPDYQDLDDSPPSGEYWTPVPDELYADPEPSARGYGWPVPVERLPQVPAYEPATGFDLTPVEAAEPTAAFVPRAVPRMWPPESEDLRVRLPRSWRDRDEKRPDELRSFRDYDERRSWRDRDLQQEGRGRRERPRPRPRPTAQASGYVSRHAAGPYG